jgi:hypothetical protein
MLKKIFITLVFLSPCLIFCTPLIINTLSNNGILYELNTNQGKRPKIAVATAAIGKDYGCLVEKGIINKKAYCKKHGYDFFHATQILNNALGFHTEKKRHPAWSKVVLTYHLLKHFGYDWVFWTDADSLIMNDEIKLEDFIEQDPSKEFLISQVYTKNLNTGQFLIKSTQWGLQLLLDAWHSGEIQELDYPNIPGMKGFGEQVHIMKLILGSSDNLNKTNILPERALNAQKWCYQKGDFLIHFIAVRGAKLQKDMETYYSMMETDR